MTPEAPKRSCWEDYRLGWRLGAEQERDRANQRLLLLRDRLRERIGTSDEASGIEHWHHASGGRSQPTERDGVFVDRRTVLDIIEHEAASLAIEREAAHPSGAGSGPCSCDWPGCQGQCHTGETCPCHPSGAGSGLREALERIARPVSNGYEGDTQNREELVRWMVRTARHALAASPTVSRDGEVAAALRQARVVADLTDRVTDDHLMSEMMFLDTLLADAAGRRVDRG